METLEEENTRLKQELVRIRDIHKAFFTIPPPDRPENMPTGPPELIHGYKVGFINGWVSFRRQLKKAIHPDGGG